MKIPILNFVFFKRGFTLTELLIVIGVFAILVGIVIPVFRTYQPSLQLSGSVRDLVLDLRYAQQISVTEQINHGVRFSAINNDYQIIRYGETEEIISSKKLPETVVFYEINGLVDNHEAVFNPYGAIAEAGSIALINTKDKIIIIDIRSSGFVKIIK